MTPGRIAVALAVLAAGCATDGGDNVKHTQALAPYAMHEDCARLAVGDRVVYAFRSDAALDFNIHYQDGAAVVEPITRQGITEDAGVYAPPLAHRYCLMWEAGAAGAHLDYRMRVLRAPQ